MTNKEKALDAINGRIESEKKAFSSCEEFMKKDYTQFFVQQADKAYKAARMVTVLTDTAKWMENADENAIANMVASERDFHFKQLVNGRIMTESTSCLYNLSRSYELQMNQELYKFYLRLYNSLCKNNLNN